jgi:hypothetical protein
MDTQDTTLTPLSIPEDESGVATKRNVFTFADVSTS